MPVNGLDRASFADVFHVSRETMQSLDHYVDLIQKWNRSINLVSKSTLDDIWSRHIYDSAQLFGIAGAKSETHWLDLGSGGGLPAIVIAIMASSEDTPLKLTMIESDTRKCAFLRTTSRELNLNATIIENRIDAVQPLKADIISARALAGLPELLRFAELHGKTGTICLFPKGQTHNAELTQAKESWNIAVESFPSKTDSSARILKIKDIRRASQL